MPRKKTLNVYSGTINVPGTRRYRHAILACRTQKLASELFGVSLHEMRDFFTRTRNKFDTKLALSYPGIVLYDASSLSYRSEREEDYIPLPWRFRFFDDKKLKKIENETLLKEIEHTRDFISFEINITNDVYLEKYLSKLLIETSRRGIDI